VKDVVGSPITPNTLPQFVSSVGLDECILKNLENEELKFEQLNLITDEQWKEIGVTKMGQRLAIKDYFKRIVQ